MAARFAVNTLAVLAVAGAAGFAGKPATAATNYPWCGHYMMQNGPKNCGFATLEQCRASVSGIGGFCDVNPSYTPAAPTPARPRRSRAG